jgi:hypothetical protein
MGTCVGGRYGFEPSLSISPLTNPLYFVRSIFAAAYSSQGGHCYDSASPFVLLVFAFVDGYEYLSDFVRDLHHPDKGRQYRELAGIQDDCIPQEASLLWRSE